MKDKDDEANEELSFIHRLLLLRNNKILRSGQVLGETVAASNIVQLQHNRSIHKWQRIIMILIKM